LVIVNDGSTDFSKNIILAYTDPRIRYFENEANSGIVYTRNKGLGLASGTYIATLDSDDIALPQRAENQVDFLEKNPDHGMCGTFYDTIDSNGGFLKKNMFPTNNRDVSSFLILGNCFCNSTIMIRNELAKELKYRPGYDIVEDYDLWYRVSRKAKLTNLPFTGTYYRIHGNNISVSKMNDMFARVHKINRQIITDLNIDFTEEELEIHSCFLRVDIDFFRDEARFNALEPWILKLYTQLQNEQKYNEELLFTLIAEKWVIVCFNTKRYKKLLYTKLSGINRIAYYNAFWKRIYGKIVKK
jgi:glycosyltransferase involved in cell wall biosynthesis